MTTEPEGSGSLAQRLRCGVVVSFIAVILGCGPFIGKIYLRSTIPHIDVNLPKWRHIQSSATTDFLKRQLDYAYERALSLATRLDSSNHVNSQKELASYREAVTMLHTLHTKFESSLEAINVETCNWQYPFLRGRVEARESAVARAQHLNNLMMAAFSLIAAVFLFFALRSPRIPDWAKRISMMTAGAVLAGWLPL